MLAVFPLFIACSTSQPEAAPPPEAAPAPAATVAAPVARRLPPPRPEGLSTVQLVGHGLRIRVSPPFQVVRVRYAMGIAADADHKVPAEDLLIAWWDVADPVVGRGGGRGGLYNSRVAAAPAPREAAIRQTRHLPENGLEVVRYQRGETGSYVQLPPDLLGAGGMLTVEPGPADASWTVEAGGTSVPLESEAFLQSADPESGPGFEFAARPSRPWGPWP